jgi:hypothetical protein
MFRPPRGYCAELRIKAFQTRLKLSDDIGRYQNFQISSAFHTVANRFLILASILAIPGILCNSASVL